MNTNYYCDFEKGLINSFAKNEKVSYTKARNILRNVTQYLKKSRNVGDRLHHHSPVPSHNVE